MRSLYLLFFICAACVQLSGQEPGYYFGPRLELGQAQFTGQTGFYNGLALQVGLTSSRQFTDGFALQFTPFVGMYNGQRQNGEGDGVYPNGTRKILSYRDKYNIYSVEFPLLVKFSGGFRRAQFSIFGGPSLGYLMGGTRSKHYDDPDHNAEHGYSGHGMEDLKRGMYSGDIGVASELAGTRGLLMIDFRIHHNFSPLGRLEGNYFTAHMMTVGLAWTFNAL
jgi:hypothetical protein